MQNKKCILFVCSGNTCRSPMAEFILKHKLNSLNIDDVYVDFAGLNADLNSTISIDSQRALKILGIKFDIKNCKQFSKQIVNKNTIIITMTAWQKEMLNNFENVYCCLEFNYGKEISDPFMLGLEKYLQIGKQLSDICDNIINKIKEGKL